MVQKIALALCSILVLAGCGGAKKTAYSDQGMGAAMNSQNTVYFDFNRSDINESEKGKIGLKADELKNNPGAKAVIEGHADVRGTTEYNLALGERRGAKVKQEIVRLLGNKKEAGRIEVISYGKERPVAAGDTEADHAQNRRAVIDIKK